MQKYNVLSETFTTSDGGEFVKGDVVELDPTEAQGSINEGWIELIVDEEKKEAEKPLVPPVEPGTEKDVEPRKRYHGIVILSETVNVVGDQTFKHIALVDGTEYDLTDVEYNGEVHVSYPPHN